MQYSQGQLRRAVGLTVEAYRHWKRVLPPFSSRKGHSAKFHVGDILAVAILKRLTDVCSIKVGNLADISDELVSLCNSASLAELEKLILLVDLKNNVCKTVPFSASLASSDVFIVVPLAAVIFELREDLLEMQNGDAQGKLALSLGHSEEVIPTQSGFDNGR